LTDMAAGRSSASPDGAGRLFGTDGVRGIVGDAITADLVERLGRAAATISLRGRVLVGRDPRASGALLEASLARGIASAGGVAVLAGVLPTPAVALMAYDLGAVVTASHNPPEYNGVKFFDRDGHKLSDEDEERIEALVRDGVGAVAGGTIEQFDGAADSHVEHLLERFGSDLSGLRIAVDCANGAYAGLAPRAFERLGAQVTAIGNDPDGLNINVGCGATDLALLRETVRAGDVDLGVAFDGDGDRILAVDAQGEVVDGDRIVAILALALGVDQVAVTVMTNLGFHRLMAERGIRVHVTDVGDRHVLEALRREGALLGGEQSGHVIWLRDHVTGDGLAIALLLCAALGGRRLSRAAAVYEPFPQVTANVRVGARAIPAAVLAEVERLNRQVTGRGRVLVRPSGTEPVVRVLAEAESREEAENLCGTIAQLVEQTLG
jgi:phosphoglucosamine mutase